MNSNDRDPIIDAMLDEWLGNRTPSSFSADELGKRPIDARLAAELDQALQSASLNVRNRRLGASASDYRTSKSYSSVFSILAAIAACLVVGAGVWAVALQYGQGTRVANEAKVALLKNKPNEDLSIPKESSTAIAASASEKSEAAGSKPLLSAKQNRESLSLDSLPFNAGESVASKSDSSANRNELSVKLDELEVVKAIDREILQAWNINQSKPAAPINGVAWIDRAAQKLLSRSASQEEKDAFAKKDSLALRLESLHRMVDSPEFSRVWARRLAAYYLDVPPFSTRDTTPERRAFVLWIRDEINRTHRLDSVVKNIVFADGINESKGDLPPSAHWWSEVGLRSSTAPAEVLAAKFLGERTSCSRCHDASKVADADQNRFWGIAAITEGIEASGPGSKGKTRLEFRTSTAPLFYERENATMVAAVPSLPNGQILKERRGNPSEIAAITKQNLASLNDWMLQSDELAKSHANFVWQSLFSQPLIANYPLDDSEGGKERTAIADLLAEQLRSNEFDLRKIVVWVAASQAFGLESIQQDADWYLKASDKELASYRSRQMLFASYPAVQDREFKSLDKLVSWFDSSKILGTKSGKVLANPIAPTLPAGSSKKSNRMAPEAVSKVNELTKGQLEYLVMTQSLPKSLQEEVDRLAKSSLAWNVLVDHAFYMTGTTPPTQIDREAAQKILDLSRDKRVALSRIIAARL